VRSGSPNSEPSQPTVTLFVGSCLEALKSGWGRGCPLGVLLAKPASHWPRSRVEQSKFRSDNFEPHKSSDNFRPAPTSSFLYQPKPQTCLTEKSRSRAPPATPCSPRRSPRRLAASSCSTRHVCRETRHAHYSDILQWSYEEVEVRDISLTYVHPPASRRTRSPGRNGGDIRDMEMRSENLG
jgi:hypothetical protein